jgi:hypothetical protein
MLLMAARPQPTVGSFAARLLRPRRAIASASAKPAAATGVTARSHLAVSSRCGTASRRDNPSHGRAEHSQSPSGVLATRGSEVNRDRGLSGEHGDGCRQPGAQQPGVHGDPVGSSLPADDRDVEGQSTPKASSCPTVPPTNWAAKDGHEWGATPTTHRTSTVGTRPGASGGRTPPPRRSLARTDAAEGGVRQERSGVVAREVRGP